MDSYNTANIKILAEQLRWVKDNSKDGYSVAVLLGAGISISAGIPSAEGMIKEIKNTFPTLSAGCKQKNYQGYMSLLSPSQRKQIIGTFVDKAKINIAHLYLGALVKERYVDRILTTNFDPLITKSLALYNIYPAVYDFAASQKFIPGEAAELSVFYLHGQRDGFILLNTEEGFKKHKKKLKDVFTEVGRKRIWIVIGYSGENDPVFERLAEIKEFHHKLYWIGYKDAEPKEHVLKKILSPSTKQGYYINGYNADEFFIALTRELQLPEPQILSRPFSHLKEAVSNIAEFIVDEKIADMTKETKEWINIAIEGFEERKGFARISDIKKKRFDQEDLIRRTRNLWVHSQFNQIDEIYDSVIDSNIIDAKKYLSFAYFNRANSLAEQALKRVGDETITLLGEATKYYNKAVKLNPVFVDAYNNWGNTLSNMAKAINKPKFKDSLLKQAIVKYEKALDIENNKYGALYNLGNALVNLSENKSKREKEKLLREAITKFTRSLKQSPNQYEAFNNRGDALLLLADLTISEERENLLKQGIDDYKSALELAPNTYQSINNLGNAYLALAEEKEGKDAEDLSKKSIEQYKKAKLLNPQQSSVSMNWGNVLLFLSKYKKNKSKENILRLALDKYQEALELDPKYFKALYYAGSVFVNLAKYKKGEASESLLKQSIRYFRKALKLKTDQHEVLNSWGNSLLGLSKLKKGKESEKIIVKAINILMKAEELKRGSGSYNLACAYSLMGENNSALIWLKQSLKLKAHPPKKYILSDTDLNIVKETEQFKRIIDRYLP